MQGHVNVVRGGYKDQLFAVTLFTLPFMILAIALSFAPKPGVADNTSPWLSTDNPNLEKVADIPASYQLPTIVAGMECYDGEVRTSYTNYHTGCINRLPYGKASNTGYIYMNGGALAAKFENYSSTLSPLGVPNSTTVLSTGGSLLRFTKNVTESLTSTSSSIDGSAKVKLNRPPDALLRDKAGTNLGYQYDTIAFSNNGQWLVVDSPNLAMLRVNLETFEVLPFRAPFVYGTGTHPSTEIAISDDGRYAAVRSVSSFEIFDLSTCAAVPDTITGPVNCQKKSLLEFLRAQEGNDTQPPVRMDFVENYTLSFIVRYGTTSPIERGKYLMSAAGHTTSRSSYLALGDSFASGEGAYEYEPGTDTSTNGCHTSRLSYPYLITADLGISSFHSVACSGAESQHILARAQYPDLPVPNPLGTWLPGRYPQITYVAWGQPEVITISVIGNDIDFEGKVMRCTRASTCFNTAEERTSIGVELNNKFTILTDVFREIKSASLPSTSIYVMGYPQIAMENGSCGQNVRFDSDEVKLTNQIVNHLNYVIEQAAAQEGVKYINISDALHGHRLCEPTSNKALHAYSPGTETPLPLIGPAKKESYHPNTLGHRLLKQKIISETQSFSLTNPEPTPVSAPDLSSPTAQALLEGFVPAPSTHLPLYEPYIMDDFVYKDAVIDIHMTNVIHGLQPNSNYEVELRSTPIPIGTFTTDSKGTLDFSVTIPNNIDAGYHTMHILGKNMAGEDIDIYKTVYIAHSEEDYDGDGILNDADPCVFSEHSGVDEDEDGIDDACDGYIDFSPTKVSQLYRARNGNTANGESASKVFVERNVQIAEELFGITDADPDGDGWSIVGEGDGTIYGQVGQEELEDNGLTIEVLDRFVPYVSVRHPEKGCVRVTPEDLSEVASGTPKGLQILAEDTDTCRSEPPDADTDDDGIADELQPLYRARNGNILKGEDLFKIYIERNLVAAEAVLGRSDYDADNDAWALVGVSDQILGAQYNRLLLADSSGNVLSQDGAFTQGMLDTLTQDERRQVRPIALYQSLLLQCEAVEPQSLATVKSGEGRVAETATGFNGECN
jgi:hypothetical protein